MLTLDLLFINDILVAGTGTGTGTGTGHGQIKDLG